MIRARTSSTVSSADTNSWLKGHLCLRHIIHEIGDWDQTGIKYTVCIC